MKKKSLNIIKSKIYCNIFVKNQLNIFIFKNSKLRFFFYLYDKLF